METRCADCSSLQEVANPNMIIKEWISARRPTREDPSQRNCLASSRLLHSRIKPTGMTASVAAFSGGFLGCNQKRR